MPDLSAFSFRMRGVDLNRVEGFSDCVFAFALTLLVVSLEVPKNIHELFGVMRGFLAFAICFVILLMIWLDHHTFFRRYGLEDRFVIVLNAILLFVVLLYVYPMKFLFGFLVDTMIWRLLPPQSISQWDMRHLMLIYSSGFLAVATIFLLLYVHAYRRREALGLNALELLDTQDSLYDHCINGSFALISILIALFVKEGAALAGLIYMLLGIPHAIRGTIMGRRRRALEAQLAAQRQVPV